MNETQFEIERPEGSLERQPQDAKHVRTAETGALEVLDANGDLVALYAEGEWLRVRVVDVA